MSGRSGVVLFFTIHDALKLDKMLRARGLNVKAIPTPRQFSSDCGTALRFPLEDRDTVRHWIQQLDLEIKGIRELED